MKIKSIWLSVFVIFVIVGCTIPTVTPTPTPFPDRRDVGANTIPLREKWRVSSGSIENYAGVYHVATMSDQGLLYAAERQLVLANSQNGQVIWQTGYGGRADDLVVNEERVFLTNDYRITAYHLTDGQQLWQTKQQGGHRWYGLYLDDGFLFEYVLSSWEAEITYKYDPQTGVRLDTWTHPVPEAEAHFLLPLETIDLWRQGRWLLATAKGSDQVLWRLAIGSDRTTKPVLTDELLVFTRGVVEFDLLVLELESGQIRWQKSGFVSNAAVIGNTVYAIANNGSISAYDLISGQRLGEVEVKPSVTDTHLYSYALIANEKDQLLYAYYGDSEEILAFGK